MWSRTDPAALRSPSNRPHIVVGGPFRVDVHGAAVGVCDPRVARVVREGAGRPVAVKLWIGIFIAATQLGGRPGVVLKPMTASHPPKTTRADARPPSPVLGDLPDARTPDQSVPQAAGPIASAARGARAHNLTLAAPALFRVAAFDVSVGFPTPPPQAAGGARPPRPRAPAGRDCCAASSRWTRSCAQRAGRR